VLVILILTKFDPKPLCPDPNCVIFYLKAQKLLRFGINSVGVENSGLKMNHDVILHNDQLTMTVMVLYVWISTNFLAYRQQSFIEVIISIIQENNTFYHQSADNDSQLKNIQKSNLKSKDVSLWVFHAPCRCTKLVLMVFLF
jgi:hypothetical protein